MDAMDFRLSDPYLDPEGTDLSVYSEKTIRLPRTYWCYSPLGPTPAVSPMPSAVSGAVTFGCLNNFLKVSTSAVETWARLLMEVDGSRLLLLATEGSARKQLTRRFDELGVDPNRVEYAGKQSWDAYLDLYSRIDIALDPYPYGGGITTCDAIWMGVPVVTLSGKTAVGRGGRSILSNLGLADLVAESPEGYIETAASLAADTGRRTEFRATLRETMEASPLRDGAGLARDLEDAFLTMVDR
jgi:predicted O-linked N-acetylglucosamine transferase (SPINDLY family)